MARLRLRVLGARRLASSAPVSPGSRPLRSHVVKGTLARLVLVALTGLLFGGIVGLPLALGQAASVATALGPATALSALVYAAWRDHQRDALERARLAAEITREQRSSALAMGQELLRRRWAAYGELHDLIIQTGDNFFRSSLPHDTKMPTPRIAEVQQWLRTNGLLVSDETRHSLNVWQLAATHRQSTWSFPPSPMKGQAATDYARAEGDVIETMRRDLRVRSFDELP